MEITLLLYFLIGAVGFLVMHHLRKLRERPSIIPTWLVILYYVIAALLLLLSGLKERNQPEFVDPFLDEPELQQMPYKQGSISIPNN